MGRVEPVHVLVLLIEVVDPVFEFVVGGAVLVGRDDGDVGVHEEADDEVEYEGVFEETYHSVGDSLGEGQGLFVDFKHYRCIIYFINNLQRNLSTQ